MFGVQLPWLHEFLDLGDGDLPGHGAERVEVHRGGVEDEVAVAVALPGVHQSEVGGQRLLKDVVGAVEAAHLLRRGSDRDVAAGVVLLRQAAVGHLGTDAGRRVEGGDAGPAGAQLLGQRALRGEDHLELTGKVLPREFLVLPHVGADGAADPAVPEQDPEPPVVDSAVVAHGVQVCGAALVQGIDQGHRNAAEPEPADGEGGAVADVRDGFGGAGNNFVNHR
ncbi:hypothetical protein BJQ90_02536 [Arthrobacter sp. SO3]|nr:hypothetical protein [Arthrobacter sp. SO3]